MITASPEREESAVDTWVIVLIVVVVVALLAVLALTMAKRNRINGARKREQARDHLREAELRATQAEKEQAAAEEQAARARRERAEVEERTRLAEQEAQERASRAGEHASAAEQLRAKAEKLAPGLADQHGRHADGRAPQAADDRTQTYQQATDPDQPSGGATRRTWTLGEPHLLAQEVAAVSIDTRGPAPRVLAGVQYGHWGPTVMRSDDLGASWQETETGAIRFPEDTGAALARVWQLRPDAADRPGVVWAGCEPHSLWRSTDGGCTFELVRGLWDHPHRPTWEPGGGGGAVHTVLPDPASDRVTIAMSTGGVYVSEDGGGDWTPRNSGISAVFLPEPPEYGQCVHKVAVDAAGPDRMYAQNHFGVFRTDDAGGSWTSIAEGLPADFGFPVVASPSTPGTAWVVPLVADVQRVPPSGRVRGPRPPGAGGGGGGPRAGP